jgi:hypothetical protein
MLTFGNDVNFTLLPKRNIRPLAPALAVDGTMHPTQAKVSTCATKAWMRQRRAVDGMRVASFIRPLGCARGTVALRVKPCVQVADNLGWLRDSSSPRCCSAARRPRRAMSPSAESVPTTTRPGTCRRPSRRSPPATLAPRPPNPATPPGSTPTPPARTIPPPRSLPSANCRVRPATSATVAVPAAPPTPAPAPLPPAPPLATSRARNCPPCN